MQIASRGDSSPSRLKSLYSAHLLALPCACPFFVSVLTAFGQTPRTGSAAEQVVCVDICDALCPEIGCLDVPIDCADPELAVGACCLRPGSLDGICAQLSHGQCADLSGSFRGAPSTCEFEHCCEHPKDTCDVPRRCCGEDLCSDHGRTCALLSNDTCSAEGGIPLSSSSNCETCQATNARQQCATAAVTCHAPIAPGMQACQGVPPARCGIGDKDQDCDLDLADFASFQDQFMASIVSGDFDLDGDMDLVDYAIFESYMEAIPGLYCWQVNMELCGRCICEYIASESFEEDPVRWTQYDGQRVFFQVGDYVGKHAEYWYGCAQAAERLYRNYVEQDRNTLAFYSSTDGLTLDYLRTGDEKSRDAVLGLGCCAAYARETTKTCTTVTYILSREVAFTIRAYLNAERIGQPRRARLATLVDHALGHFDQWFGTENVAPSAEYVRPFMVGLSAEALITYYEQTGESYDAILVRLITAANWLWANMWIDDAGAFMYTNRLVSDCNDLAPAPDLNLLIAPFFAWLYHQTGDLCFRDRADAIFRGGVMNASLHEAKHFNQSYRWTFDYVNWRIDAPLREASYRSCSASQ